MKYAFLFLLANNLWCVAIAHLMFLLDNVMHLNVLCTFVEVHGDTSLMTLIPVNHFRSAWSRFDLGWRPLLEDKATSKL